jgi:hypothetical protein
MENYSIFSHCIINYGFEFQKGGVGIHCSMDTLASKYLKYDYPDGPRLVSLKLQKKHNETKTYLAN